MRPAWLGAWEGGLEAVCRALRITTGAELKERWPAFIETVERAEARHAHVAQAVVFRLLREGIEKPLGVDDSFVDGLEEDRLALRDPTRLLAEAEIVMRRRHPLEAERCNPRGEQREALPARLLKHGCVFDVPRHADTRLQRQPGRHRARRGT